MKNLLLDASKFGFTQKREYTAMNEPVAVDPVPAVSFATTTLSEVQEMRLVMRRPKWHVQLLMDQIVNRASKKSRNNYVKSKYKTKKVE